MKKTFVLLALMTVAILLCFGTTDSSKKEEKKMIKKLSQHEIFNSQDELKVSKKAPTIQKKGKKIKELDINKMHPCDALSVLANHKEPWSFLDKNYHKSYIEAQRAIKVNFDDEGLNQDQRVQIYTAIDDFSNTDYIPYLEDIYKEATKANTNRKLIEKIKWRLSYEYDTQRTLEGQLSHAKELYEKGDMADSIFLLNTIAEDQMTNSNSLEKLYLSFYKSASTPSEISAAIETFSRIPTFDFTFLLDIKKKHGSKSINKILDKIALKLINRTLSTKSALAVDYLSYEIALGLHSKGGLIRKKYGSREDIVKRFISKESSDNSQTCDDRELIDLCTKYCKK